MMIAWLEEAVIQTLGSASPPHFDYALPEHRLGILLSILPSGSPDGPCLAHVGDAGHYILSVLGDAALARLSRRFSSRSLSSFAGCTVEIKSGVLRCVSKSTANVVLMIDDFVVVGMGGCIADSLLHGVGGDHHNHHQTFVMQSANVKRAAKEFCVGRKWVGGPATELLLELDTICSQYAQDENSSDGCLSFDEEDCVIPKEQAERIDAVLGGGGSVVAVCGLMNDPLDTSDGRDYCFDDDNGDENEYDDNANIPFTLSQLPFNTAETPPVQETKATNTQPLDGTPCPTVGHCFMVRNERGKAMTGSDLQSLGIMPLSRLTEPRQCNDACTEECDNRAYCEDRVVGPAAAANDMIVATQSQTAHTTSPSSPQLRIGSLCSSSPTRPVPVKPGRQIKSVDYSKWRF